MKLIVGCLMAVWLLFTAITGWCCHAPCGCARIQVAKSKQRPGCCCKSCCRAREEQQQIEVAAVCPCKSGCRGVCTYLTASKTQIDGRWILATWEQAVDLWQCESLQHPLRDSWEPWRSRPPLDPSVRIHLAN